MTVLEIDTFQAVNAIDTVFSRKTAMKVLDFTAKAILFTVGVVAVTVITFAVIGKMAYKSLQGWVDDTVETAVKEEGVALLPPSQVVALLPVKTGQWFTIKEKEEVTFIQDGVEYTEWDEDLHGPAEYSEEEEIEEEEVKKITPELLLSKKGKELKGGARTARINKLLKEGYVL